MDTDFSIELAIALNDMERSGEQFPVDFDLAWQWIGYNKKQNATEILEQEFEEGTDYMEVSQGGFYTEKSKKSDGFSTGDARLTLERESDNHADSRGRGRPARKIFLTIECFKMLGMMAGTAKGKEIRKYFIECEKIAKEATRRLMEQVNNGQLTDRQLVLMAVRETGDPIAIARTQKELFPDLDSSHLSEEELARQIAECQSVVSQAKSPRKTPPLRSISDAMAKYKPDPKDLR